MSTPNHPNPPTTSTKPLVPAWLLWTFLLLPVLYVLSIGPFARHYYGNPKSPPHAFRAFYAPLQALNDHFTPAHAFFDWYIYRLWLGQPPPQYFDPVL